MVDTQTLPRIIAKSRSYCDKTSYKTNVGWFREYTTAPVLSCYLYINIFILAHFGNLYGTMPYNFQGTCLLLLKYLFTFVQDSNGCSIALASSRSRKTVALYMRRPPTGAWNCGSWKDPSQKPLVQWLSLKGRGCLKSTPPKTHMDTQNNRIWYILHFESHHFWHLCQISVA